MMDRTAAASTELNLLELAAQTPQLLKQQTEGKQIEEKQKAAVCLLSANVPNGSEINLLTTRGKISSKIFLL